MQTYLQHNINDIQRYLASSKEDEDTLRLNSARTPSGRSKQFKDAMDHAYIRLCEILNWKMELFDPWRSDTANPDIVEHFKNLRIPTINHKPSLLLHRLGEIPEKNPIALEELTLREERLREIFCNKGPQYGLNHSVLFNTSGAGKTRLVLEGLCKEWGFYFTCKRSVSECGSTDLDVVLDPSDSGYLNKCGLIEHVVNSQHLASNERCARRCFRAVLVARLMVFQCLLAAYEAQGKITTIAELKRIWLFVQLDSRLLAHSHCPDLLLELTTLLCHIPKLSDSDIILAECQLFLESLVPGSLPPGDRIPIFCVIDEVQNASDLFPDAFRGGQTGSDPRPALRELLKVWSIGMHFVITGTSLNIQHIRCAISSTVGKFTGQLESAITSTGSFIDKDEQIDSYLNHYIPSRYLKSPIGKELSRRARYWLVGRPRFIASFVQCLILHNFQYCHQLLTSYIRAITKFSPTDGTYWEYLEGPMPKSPIDLPAPFNLDRAAVLDHISRNDLMNSIQRLVNHRLLRGRTDFETSGEGLVDSKLVECGFARYPDGKAATFDEPLAYLAADFWLSSCWSSRHQYFLKDINQNSSDQNGLERYIAICLAHIFREFTPLSAFFRFAHNLGKPKLLENRKARLVSCWIDSSREFRVAPVVFPFDNKVDKSYGYVIEGASSPSNILGYTSTNPSDDLQWLNFGINAPFLFPDEFFGPDLMFRLQLEGGELVTVALQVKYREKGTTLTRRTDMISAIKSVNPAKFWKNIKNEVSAPISNPNIHIDSLNALDRLANRFDSKRGGYHSVICGLFAYPATDNETTCKKILQKITQHETEYEFDTAHEFFVIPSAPIIALTNPMPPFEGLKRLEEGIQRRVRDNLEKSKFTRKINGRKPRRRPTPASQHLLVKL